MTRHPANELSPQLFQVFHGFIVSCFKIGLSGIDVTDKDKFVHQLVEGDNVAKKHQVQLMRLVSLTRKGDGLKIADHIITHIADSAPAKRR